MKICKVDECDSPHLARGYCRKHYLRWYKHGNHTIIGKAAVLSGVEHPCYKHGHWDHPLYGVWSKMISRCENPKDAAYRHYGGRGITVCDRWHNIEIFIQDMGEWPDGLTLERTDVNLGYGPENCCWASYTTQSRNRRYTKLTKEAADLMRKETRRSRNGRGCGMTREDIAEKYGVSLATVKKVLSGAYWK